MTISSEGCLSTQLSEGSSEELSFATPSINRASVQVRIPSCPLAVSGLRWEEKPMDHVSLCPFGFERLTDSRHARFPHVIATLAEHASETLSGTR